MKRLALGLVIAATAGCRSPTQITFDVTTNVPCAQVDDTWVTAGSLAVFDTSGAPTTVAPRCTSEGHIGSLVVVPSGDDGDLVAVQIVTGVGVAPETCAKDASKCIVAKRALHFIPHEPLTVHVAMNAACEGVVCSGAQTCVDGACKDAVIGDPSACAGAGCGGEVLGPGDGGAPIDAGSNDATLGDGGDGAAGDGGTDAEPASDVAIDAGKPVPIGNLAIGQRASCAILDDRGVACWGSNDTGQLANGQEGPGLGTSTPTRVANLDHVAQLVGGAGHFCALLDDGGVSCWGFAGNGATPSGHSGDSLVPDPVILADGGRPPAFGRIGSSENGMCATTPDARTIWCWGEVNIDSPINGVYSPQLVATLDAAVTDMRGGWGFMCATFDDGALRCWGSNYHHALGLGIGDAGAVLDTPTVVDAGPVARLSTGGADVCIVTPAHRAVCWGENDEHELGPNVTNGNDVELPADIGLDHILQLGSGDDHTCALFDDGGVSCWGADGTGELGFDAGGIYATVATPTPVPNLGPATGIVVGPNGACAQLVDGRSACWGANGYGQLGVGIDAAAPYGAFPLVVP